MTQRWGRPLPVSLLADAATPALRAVVDYGYPDNDPLANPQKYTPARLIPTREETERFVTDFTAGVGEGADILRDGASTARSAPEPTTTTRPPLRRSLDFSPKAAGREKASAPQRAGVQSGAPVLKGVRALAKRLRGGESGEPAAQTSGPGAGESAGD